MTDEENPVTTDGGDGTRHVRMPVPPGGDADRHPGSPDLGDPDPGADADDPATSSGHPTRGAATASTGTRACRARPSGRRGR